MASSTRHRPCLSDAADVFSNAKGAARGREHVERENRVMKRVVAIIRPYKLDDVKGALSAIGVSGVTVSEVKGSSPHRGPSNLYRGTEFINDYSSRVKLEVALTDEEVPGVVNAIERAARTGKAGDGKIMISSVDEVIRIRTGDRGVEAL